MPAVAFNAGLHHLAHGVYAYLQPSGSWGLSNCGLVHDGASALLFDTQFTIERTQNLIAAISAALPGVVVQTVVNSHANGDHSWGNQCFPSARLISSASTAAGMHAEISPESMTAMREGSDPASPAGQYMRRYFGIYDFSGITITPATETFTGRCGVTVGARHVDLIEVGPAHTDGDVIAHIPDAGVVFAGDILFVNDHPVMWDGPIGNWIAACDLILSTGATTIVGGHGPVTDPAGVREIRAYLEHVADHATGLHRRGVPHDEAARRLPLERYSTWGHPERLVVTIGTIYRNLGGPAPDRQALIMQMMTAGGPEKDLRLQ